ncbi:MAG: helix-turn-helix domain-containing protein [Lachnospiraceae bacterium]|nr:helix-turn-helix domain-containing protein [Lachnospiraceae bacterium]
MELGKNISALRKEKGFSQENLAEKVNVTRQTISNWELSETSPNPEQLILLSKALDKSIDELVGNDFKHISEKESGSDTKRRIKIYTGLAFICGTIAGIWAFSANRFRYDEMIFIVAGGLTIGLFLASVCQAILNN